MNEKIQKNPSTLMRTYGILLFCVICWGSNFIFGAILVDVFDPIAIAFFRLLFINVFLWIVGWRFVRRKRIPVKMLFKLAIVGFVGVTINHWTFYASLEYTDPVTAALIFALAPLMTSLITFFYLKESRKGVFWVGVFIGFIGVAFIVTGGSVFTLSIGKGEILIGLTMLSFAVFLVMVQQLSKSIRTIVITLYSNVFGLLLFIPFFPFGLVKQSLNVDLKYWALLIITGILMHGICTMLWNASLRKIGASNASMLLNFEPFVAMVVGYIVLHQIVQPIQLFGSILIITGVLMGTRADKTNSALGSSGL